MATSGSSQFDASQFLTICGVCKSNTAVKRVQCIKCEVFYHLSCVSKLKGVQELEKSTIICCGVPSNVNEPYPDLNNSLDSLNESFLSTKTQGSEVTLTTNKEVMYLKSIVRNKNVIIKELNAKIVLLNQVIDLQAKQVASPFNTNSKPVPPNYEDIPVPPNSNLNLNVSAQRTNYAQALSQPLDPKGQAKIPQQDRQSSGPTNTQAGVNKSKLHGNNINIAVNSGNIVPVKDTRQTKTIIGKRLVTNNISHPAFSASVPKRCLFLSKVAPGTTCDSVTEYVKGVTGITSLDCQALTNNSEYCSFKLSVLHNDYSKLINEDVWPEGVLLRDFIFNRKPQSSRNYSKNHRPRQRFIPQRQPPLNQS